MLRDHCDYTRPGAEPWWQGAGEGEPVHARPGLPVLALTDARRSSR